MTSTVRRRSRVEGGMTEGGKKVVRDPQRRSILHDEGVEMVPRLFVLSQAPAINQAYCHRALLMLL